jgi:hypothetical protein
MKGISMLDHRGMNIAGLSGVLAGVFIILTRVLQICLYGRLPLSVHGGDDLFVPFVGLPGLIGSILFLLSVVGLYLFQSDRSGIVGFLVFILAFIGISLSLGANWTYAFGSPYISATAPEILDTDFGDPVWGVFGKGFIYSYLFAALGYILFSLWTLIVGKVPRWIGVVMLVSMPLAGVLPFGTAETRAIMLNVLMGSGPMISGWFLIRQSKLAQSGL